MQRLICGLNFLSLGGGASLASSNGTDRWTSGRDVDVPQSDSSGRAGGGRARCRGGRLQLRCGWDDGQCRAILIGWSSAGLEQHLLQCPSEVWMQAALSLVENLDSNALHHPGDQVIIQRHGVHPRRLQRGRGLCHCHVGAEWRSIRANSEKNN